MEWLLIGKSSPQMLLNWTPESDLKLTLFLEQWLVYRLLHFRTLFIRSGGTLHYLEELASLKGTLIKWASVMRRFGTIMTTQPIKVRMTLSHSSVITRTVLLSWTVPFQNSHTTCQYYIYVVSSIVWTPRGFIYLDNCLARDLGLLQRLRYPITLIVEIPHSYVGLHEMFMTSDKL